MADCEYVFYAMANTGGDVARVEGDDGLSQAVRRHLPGGRFVHLALYLSELSAQFHPSSAIWRHELQLLALFYLSLLVCSRQRLEAVIASRSPDSRPAREMYNIEQRHLP